MTRPLLFVGLVIAASALVVTCARAEVDLVAVNRAVNAEIRPQREPPGQDVWRINPAKGDCEDYAVTKLARLRDMGIPLASMKIATVKAGRDLHAVLIVGEHVLDNRYAQVGRLSDYTVISEMAANVALFRVKMQEMK